MTSVTVVLSVIVDQFNVTDLAGASELELRSTIEQFNSNDTRFILCHPGTIDMERILGQTTMSKLEIEYEYGPHVSTENLPTDLSLSSIYTFKIVCWRSTSHHGTQ